MAWSIKIEQRAELDLNYAFDHYLSAALYLGDSEAGAAQAARRRIERTLHALNRLTNNPLRGTLHNHLAPGLRNVTLDDAVFWFRPDETTQIISVVGIFHGGQDHMAQMLARLTASGIENNEGA